MASYEFVSVASFTQQAKRMILVIPSSVACPVVPDFSTLSHKRHDFRGKKKNKLLNIKYEYRFYLLLLLKTFLILRITEVVIINAHKSSCKVPVTLVRF